MATTFDLDFEKDGRVFVMLDNGCDVVSGWFTHEDALKISEAIQKGQNITVEATK